jgi:hypothetical protein
MTPSRTFIAPDPTDPDRVLLRWASDGLIVENRWSDASGFEDLGDAEVAAYQTACDTMRAWLRTSARRVGPSADWISDVWATGNGRYVVCDETDRWSLIVATFDRDGYLVSSETIAESSDPLVILAKITTVIE